MSSGPLAVRIPHSTVAPAGFADPAERKQVSTAMMGNGYNGGGWMWGFGGFMMLGTIALIGLIIWWAISLANRPHCNAIAGHSTATVAGGGRDQTRQLLDDRYARGELTTQEYTERLHTLGF